MLRTDGMPELVVPEPTDGAQVDVHRLELHGHAAAAGDRGRRLALRRA